MTGPEESLYAAEMRTPAGRHSMAAAASASQVMNLLELAKAESGLTQKQLASELNVTEGRVSQVMTGDGNFHVATIARFLDAMGAKLTLGATVGGRSLRRSRRGSPARDARMIRTPVLVEWATTEGLTTSETEIEHPAKLEILRVSVSAVAANWHTSANAGTYQQDAIAAIDAETRTVPTP